MVRARRNSTENYLAQSLTAKDWLSHVRRKRAAAYECDWHRARHAPFGAPHRYAARGASRASVDVYRLAKSQHRGAPFSVRLHEGAWLAKKQPRTAYPNG